MNFKIIFYFIFVHCYFYSVDAQQYIAKAKPVGGADWGYIDEFGEFILPPIYKYAYDFSECGFAAIYDNLEDRVYYINLEGDTILRSTAEYEFIKPESSLFTLPIVNDNTLPVIANGKQGFINQKGNLIIDTKYDKVTYFNYGVATVTKGDDFFIIDKYGSEKLIDIPNLKEVQGFNDSLALFTIEGGRVGFIGINGDIEIEPDFLNAMHYSNGLASAKNTTGLWGFINKAGEWVIVPRFKSVFSFRENSEWTVVRDVSHKVILLSKSGETNNLTDDIFGVRSFSDGLGKATYRYEKKKGSKKKKGKKNKKRVEKERDYKVGFINGQGEWVIKPDYDKVLDFKNGFAAVRKGRLCGFVNEFGIQVISPSFLMVGDMIKVNVTNDLNSCELSYVDIVAYIELLRGLHLECSFIDARMGNVNESQPDSSVSNNDSSDLVNNEYYKNLERFYEQDRKFVNWIVGFKNDTINSGLWQKIYQYDDSDITECQTEYNDSELALIIIEMFLIGEVGKYNQSGELSYEQIESFLKEYKGEEISIIRAKWKNKN